MTRLFLLRFLESYFRHRWLFLLPVLLTASAAGLYFYTLEPKYTTKGILYVNDQSLLTSLTAVQNNEGTWWVTSAQATTNEINELLQTDAFVRAIISETDLEEYMKSGPAQVYEIISAVRKSVWLFPVGNNEVSINASYEDPQVAFQLVTSIIDSYIRWQVNTKRLDSQVAKDFFNTLIERHAIDLEEARQVLRDYYTNNPQPIRGDRPITQQLEIERLQGEIDLAASRYISALNKEEEANLAMTQIDSDVRHTYVLMDAPLLPEKADLSKRKLATQAAVFLVAGLLLSILGVTGSVILDRSFRFPVDVQTRLSLPVFAVIPGPPSQQKWQQSVRAIIRRRWKTTPEEDRSSQMVRTDLGSANMTSQEADQHAEVKA